MAVIFIVLRSPGLAVAGRTGGSRSCPSVRYPRLAMAGKTSNPDSRPLSDSSSRHEQPVRQASLTRFVCLRLARLVVGRDRTSRTPCRSPPTSVPDLVEIDNNGGPPQRNIGLMTVTVAERGVVGFCSAENLNSRAADAVRLEAGDLGRAFPRLMSADAAPSSPGGGKQQQSPRALVATSANPPTLHLRDIGAQ